jgi:hypothetical protein
MPLGDWVYTDREGFGLDTQEIHVIESVKIASKNQPVFRVVILHGDVRMNVGCFQYIYKLTSRNQTSVVVSLK